MPHATPIGIISSMFQALKGRNISTMGNAHRNVRNISTMGNTHRNVRNIPTMGNAHRNAHRQIPHYIAQCNIAHIGYKKALFSR